jgi:hypothetical protein
LTDQQTHLVQEARPVLGVPEAAQQLGQDPATETTAVGPEGIEAPDAEVAVTIDPEAAGRHRVWLLVLASLGLVLLGVLIGMVLFWGPFAVIWIDAHPYDLAREYRADYLALVADSYALDGDAQRAGSFLAYWTEEELSTAFEDARQTYPDRVQRIDDLTRVVEVFPVSPATVVTDPTLWEKIRVPLLATGSVVAVGVLGWLGFRGVRRWRARKSPTLPVTEEGD